MEVGDGSLSARNRFSLSRRLVLLLTDLLPKEERDAGREVEEGAMKAAANGSRERERGWRGKARGE